MHLNIPKELYNKSGIYIISNTINKKVYVGSTLNFAYRYNSYLRHAARKKLNRRMQPFVDRYGTDVLIFSVLEVVANTTRLSEREQVYIDKHESYIAKKGFNIQKIAQRFDDVVFKKPLPVKKYKPSVKFKRLHRRPKVIDINRRRVRLVFSKLHDLQVFNSIRDASEYLKVPINLIIKQLKGLIKTAKGNMFKFLD